MVMVSALDVLNIMNDDILKIAKENNYEHLFYIKNKGICCIARFIFTTAILYNINEIGYEGRYCFHTYKEALASLIYWKENPELKHPPGNWIKHKGEYEFSNPDYIKE